MGADSVTEVSGEVPTRPYVSGLTGAPLPSDHGKAPAMADRNSRQGSGRPCRACALGVAACAVLAGMLSAAAPAPVPEPPPRTLTVSEAVRWALENNPELAAVRLQHGMAA